MIRKAEAIHDPRGYYYFARKTLPDGRVAEVVPLFFGRARIVVGPGAISVDDLW